MSSSLKTSVISHKCQQDKSKNTNVESFAETQQESHTTKPDLLNTKTRTIIWIIFDWHNGESVTMRHLSNQTISIISMTEGRRHVKLSIQTFAGTGTFVFSILRLTWGRCFRHLMPPGPCSGSHSCPGHLQRQTRPCQQAAKRYLDVQVSFRRRCCVGDQQHLRQLYQTKIKKKL